MPQLEGSAHEVRQDISERLVKQPYTFMMEADEEVWQAEDEIGEKAQTRSWESLCDAWNLEISIYSFLYCLVCSALFNGCSSVL
jgi:hypothetical protein